MNGALTNSQPLFKGESNVSEEYRQAELMYLKSYVVWLTMREKAKLSAVKRPA